MKVIIVAAAALAFSATAVSAEQRSEVNAPAGSLGVAALDRGDYSTAESQIVGVQGANADPAKLINLGHVYLRTGRTAEAIAAWKAAAALPNQYEVITGTGEVKTTRQVAMTAIERYRTAAR